MAMQTETPSTTPSVQVVGNAFVEQYYHILHHSPDLVYKFYQDSSVISRPDQNGVMTSVTTMKGINDKICSLDYTNYKAEIKTADAQESYKEGVIVLVTGCLTGLDNLRRKFTQSFFLAPQDNGYFVFNDVFRYVDDSEPLETNIVIVDGTADNQPASLISDPSKVIDPPTVEQASLHREEVQNIEQEAQNLLANEKPVVNESNEVEPESHLTENHVSAVTESNSSTALEDAPKMSYASIVSSATKKGSSGITKVYVPANTLRVAPAKTEKKSVAVPSPAPEASVPNASNSINSADSSNAQDEGEGHSIYVKNLPLNATVSQLELEFKKFGPIKPGGVQVRSNKGFCFGFVEFQDFSSLHKAMQASPINIGGREAVVEMKRTTTRVGSGRGRFPFGRGGFRSDSFRARGNFSGVRGYGRNDYGGRGEYSGRGRVPGGRGGEYHQQGRGRGGRRGGASQNAVSA